MKKILMLVLTVALAVCLAACGGQPTVTNQDDNTVAVGSIEELEEIVNSDVTETIGELQAEYEKLVAEVDTYNAYVENVERVESYYNDILNETRLMGIRMREYGICYTEIVMRSGGTYEDKYDTIGDMYDLIYDDACGEIYDEIYDDLLGEMYDLFYSGVVRDGYDYAPYDKWYDMSSDAYDMWYDCKSDVYDEWYDTKSDIYDFWYDVHSHIYDDDEQKVKEEIAEFEEDIEKLKADEQ